MDVDRNIEYIVVIRYRTNQFLLYIYPKINPYVAGMHEPGHAYKRDLQLLTT